METKQWWESKELRTTFVALVANILTVVFAKPEWATAWLAVEGGIFAVVIIILRLFFTKSKLTK